MGAVIVCGEKIISKGHNQREKKQNALMHAEIIAINSACKKLKSWRLNDCIMYVTLEPCPMCAGAILNSRIKKLYFAAADSSYGAVVSKYNLLTDNNLNHTCEFEMGQYKEESETLIKDFFNNLRKK